MNTKSNITILSLDDLVKYITKHDYKVTLQRGNLSKDVIKFLDTEPNYADFDEFEDELYYKVKEKKLKNGEITIVDWDGPGQGGSCEIWKKFKYNDQFVSVNYDTFGRKISDDCYDTTLFFSIGGKPHKRKIF